MLHEIRGNNFHGNYGITLRGPAAGFVLSESQYKRYRAALCPSTTDCKCGGSYGEGPDPGTARVEQMDYDQCNLVPAGRDTAYESAMKADLPPECYA